MIMSYGTELKFIKEQMRRAFDAYGAIPFNTAQKSAFDLVTDVDKNIEKAVSAAIAERFPTDKILGEEFSFAQSITGRTWTIDPIDGTCNMASGSKLYGMQCSLIDGGDIVAAAVYLPHLGEWICAEKGKGCFVNDRRVTVDPSATPNNAIISFGDYPHGKERVAEIQHKAIGALYPVIAKIRMFGAACMDFSFAAQGRTHGTVVITKNLWDIAPGILLCREAGATVTDLKGLSYRFGADGVIVAANAELAELVRKSFEQKLSFDAPESKTRHDFDACVFDFDGVITDTEKFHYAAWRKAFAAVGAELTQAEYAPLKSTGKPNIIAFCERKLGRALTAAERETVVSVKDDTFKTLIEKISRADMINGAAELLARLDKDMIKTAVASSASTTRSTINKLGLDAYFDAVVDANDGYAKKPAPDVFLAAAKAVNASPKRCIAFEDSAAGIEAALACGMTVVAVGGIKHKDALFCLPDLAAFCKLLG